MSIEIETRGLDALSLFFRTAPEIADRSAVLATNYAAGFARRLASDEIRQQVNLTATYLNRPDRLGVTRHATSNDVEAVVTARNRATSLATFSSSAPSFGRRRRGIRVKVARSGGDTLKSAFFVRLPGAADGFNIGIAVRTKDGRPPAGTRGAVPIFGGQAYLLYGPSVGQVAYDVFPDIVNEVSDRQVAEFIRQFERLSKDG